MADSIDFYFDFYSPYGYLASLRIDDIAAKHGRSVTWRPILLGPVFTALGQKSLVDVPVLGEYSIKDFYRSARLHKIPFQMPEVFPSHSLPGARAFYWLNQSNPEQAKQLAQGVYQAIFVDGKDGSSADVVAAVGQSLGIDAHELLAAIQQPEVKNQLKQAVSAAMDKGIFGSPMVVIDGEQFWGNDRLEQVDLWLETGGW